MTDERDDPHFTPDPSKEKPGKAPHPAAGPHARPELTNRDATPGAGSLPDETPEGDADGGTG